MKVCFDANVVIDIATRDNWFLNSYASYDVSAMRKFDACISASSLSDIVYVLHRRGLTRSQAVNSVPLLLEMFDVFDVFRTDCEQAIATDMSDFEDALLACAACRNGVDLIVTRNTKDFANSPVKAIEPEEFVREFKFDNVTYDIVG